MGKIELYADVLEEEPKSVTIGNKPFKKSKEYDKWEKRLHSSAGWVEPGIIYKCECDEKSKTWDGAERTKRIIWDVCYGDGIGFTCERQEDAWILMHLVQIDERLKRIESKIGGLK